LKLLCNAQQYNQTSASGLLGHDSSILNEFLRNELTVRFYWC